MKQGDICRVLSSGGGQVVILEIRPHADFDDHPVARVVHIDNSTIGYAIGDITHWFVEDLREVWPSEELYDNE